MTLEEALVGATINAAASIDRAGHDRQPRTRQAARRGDRVGHAGRPDSRRRAGDPARRQARPRRSPDRLIGSGPCSRPDSIIADRWSDYDSSADMTVAQFSAALASPDPTPGGGTAAAIAGAMGTSLLVMVAGLAKSRNNTDDEKAALATARAALRADRGDAHRAGRRRCRGVRRGDGRLSACRRQPTMRRLRARRRSRRRCEARPRCRSRRCGRAPSDRSRARPWRDYGNRSAESDVGVAIGLLEGGGRRRGGQRADQPGAGLERRRRSRPPPRRDNGARLLSAGAPLRPSSRGRRRRLERPVALE